MCSGACICRLVNTVKALATDLGLNTKCQIKYVAKFFQGEADSASNMRDSNFVVEVEAWPASISARPPLQTDFMTNVCKEASLGEGRRKNWS